MLQSSKDGTMYHDVMLHCSMTQCYNVARAFQSSDFVK